MNTLFELPPEDKQHPAKYTDALLTTFARMLRDSRRVLDPFGGTGKIFLVNKWLSDLQIEALEIEPEWASLHPRTTLGDALAIPWVDGYFDAICTSPTYGNAMGGKMSKDMDKWTRIKYADKLKRDLSQNNSGALQWGGQYRDFHVKAWTEARRVLSVGGLFILNIKDHIRGGERMRVTDWHIETLTALGFDLEEHRKIDCPGMRWGQNSDKRVDYESVIRFRLDNKIG